MLNYRNISEIWPDAAEYLLRPPVGYTFPWWPQFSEMIGGMRTNELTLLCAPTGAGKTALLAGIAAQMLILKVPTFIAPVETGDTDFFIRVLENLDKCRMNTGKAQLLSKIESLSARYEEIISTYPMYISTYDNRVDIEEMILTLKFMNQEHGVKIVLLDNLNFFLKVTSAQMEKAEMDQAMHEFVMLVKQIPIHVVLVTHPRKTDGGRVESEFDIKGSSTAVQEASNVILFNRPTKEDLESKRREWNERELVFRKIRKRGENVGKRIWFGFDEGRYREQGES
jgi:replicative DNA helicase